MLLCDGIAPSCLWRSGLSWFLSRSRFFARFEAARVFTFSSLGGQLSLQKLSDLILLVLKYSTSLGQSVGFGATIGTVIGAAVGHRPRGAAIGAAIGAARSEEHTSELQSRFDLVCRLLLEKKNDCRGLLASPLAS